jgi:DNA-binding MarR family transcriptional regulator
MADDRPLELDELIHAPARLRIMATLVACPPRTAVEFVRLRALLGLTDGNLGAHLNSLESAGYVAMTKDFVGKKPRTRAAATARGRKAYAVHVAALRAILDAQPG